MRSGLSFYEGTTLARSQCDKNTRLTEEKCNSHLPQALFSDQVAE